MTSYVVFSSEKPVYSQKQGLKCSKIPKNRPKMAKNRLFWAKNPYFGAKMMGKIANFEAKIGRKYLEILHLSHKIALQ